MATTLKAQRLGLALGVLVGLVWTAGKIAIPWLTKQAIDQGIDQGGSLVVWSVLILVAGAVAGLFTALRRWTAFRESRWTETWLRERLFAHLQQLHIGYHDRAQAGQLMSRASVDLQQVQGFVVMIPLTVSNLVLIAGSVVILVAIDPVLAVVALVPLPFVNLLATRFSRAVHPAMQAVQAEQGELATVVEESVAGVRVVKGLGAEGVQRERLRVEAEDVREAALEAAVVRSRFMPAIDLLPSIGLVGVLFVGGHQVLDGELTIGALVAFNAYVVLLIWPLRMLGMTLAWAQRAAAALERIHDVLSTEPIVTDPSHPVELPDRPPLGAVRYRDVRFGYDPAQPVLDGFDLDLVPGTSVALVGATGSGKSTVARLLARFYDVQEGAVELDGVDVRDLRLHDLRRAVAIVFEDTFLFHDSIAANIALADPDAEPGEIERAARQAGAHDFIEALPDGYATFVGERGYSLSGGQRQRIAIARAVLADPRVLVLDDATSAVDPSKEEEIREALRVVMSGRTTMVIAHRPATIALADEVVLLDDGAVAARGTHEGLLTASEPYRQVLAAWAERDEGGEALADEGAGASRAEAVLEAQEVG